MKFIILSMALLAVAFAEEGDIANKKRGVPKTSPINSLSSINQKQEQLSYSNYQPSNPATQTPLYPLAPSTYTSDEQQPTSQPNYNFLPQQQMFSLPIVMQSAAPKYQIVVMKTANGQTQLTLVPQNQQNQYYTPQQFAQPSYLQYQPASTSSSNVQAASSYLPQPNSYTPQSQAQSFYQQLPLNFGANAGHSSNMFLFGQPAPQLYNNYLSPQSNYYSPSQQLLSYYQSNPQAKNQLLYGNQGSYQQGQVNSYQSPVNTEYEKSLSGPPQSSKVDNELNLNTNEYLASESQFRPIASSYGSRGPSSYKH